jgi:hypothetical protein
MLSVETFNYSMYSLATLSGERLTDYRQMEADPSMRSHHGRSSAQELLRESSFRLVR